MHCSIRIVANGRQINTDCSEKYHVVYSGKSCFIFRGGRLDATVNMWKIFCLIYSPFC